MGFIKSFMALNIINFADMARRERHRVSWYVRRVSWNSSGTAHETPTEAGLRNPICHLASLLIMYC